MYKFNKLNRGQKTPTIGDMEDFCRIISLCQKYRYQLFDDFRVAQGDELVQRVAELVAEAGKYFWVVKCKQDNKFVGFCYLYDLVGRENTNYCGTIGAVIEKEFWGETVNICGQKFIKYCFSRLGFKKLKCETFRSNPFITGILKKLGFSVEGVGRFDTLLRGKPESIISWGILSDGG